MDFNYYIEQNIPFKEKGRALDGLDCWGLVRLFYKREMGIDLDDKSSDYADTSDPIIADLVAKDRFENWIEAEKPASGDVVLCRMRNRPMHVGVYMDGGFMLHIEGGNTAKVEKIDGLKWKRRILGIYRLK